LRGDLHKEAVGPGGQCAPQLDEHLPRLAVRREHVRFVDESRRLLAAGYHVGVSGLDLYPRVADAVGDGPNVPLLMKQLGEVLVGPDHAGGLPIADVSNFLGWRNEHELGRRPAIHNGSRQHDGRGARRFAVLLWDEEENLADVAPVRFRVIRPEQCGDDVPEPVPNGVRKPGHPRHVRDA